MKAIGPALDGTDHCDQESRIPYNWVMNIVWFGHLQSVIIIHMNSYSSLDREIQVLSVHNPIITGKLKAKDNTPATEVLSSFKVFDSLDKVWYYYWPIRAKIKSPPSWEISPILLTKLGFFIGLLYSMLLLDVMTGTLHNVTDGAKWKIAWVLAIP